MAAAAAATAGSRSAGRPPARGEEPAALSPEPAAWSAGAEGDPSQNGYIACCYHHSIACSYIACCYIGKMDIAPLLYSSLADAI